MLWVWFAALPAERSQQNSSGAMQLRATDDGDCSSLEVKSNFCSQSHKFKTHCPPPPTKQLKCVRYHSNQFWTNKISWNYERVAHLSRSSPQLKKKVCKIPIHSPFCQLSVCCKNQLFPSHLPNFVAISGLLPFHKNCGILWDFRPTGPTNPLVLRSSCTKI